VELALGHPLGPDVPGHPLSEDFAANAAALEKRIGHAFKDRRLLERALSHRSFANGSNARLESYERLEFLGDRVLGLAIANELYRRYPEVNEGQLSKALAGLVRIETCAEVALALGLDRCIRMGKGERRSSLHKRTVVLGDVCEALLGALYLDAGFAAAEELVVRMWAERFDTVVLETSDPKTMLQEWAHAKGLSEPRYFDLSRSGPQHKPVFTVRASVEGLADSEGSGPTKRAAERAAAAAMLKREGVEGVRE
jgi:ribonuclease-3